MSNVRFRMHPWSAFGLLFATYCALWLAALSLHNRGKPIPIWFLRSAGIPFICVRESAIQTSSLFRRTSRRLVEVQKIEYAYHAVVGFVATWVFTFQDGKELLVPPHRAGLPRALLDLELQLSGFSIERWHKEFAEGDVEDTVLVWEAKSNPSIERTRPGEPGRASHVKR